MNRGPMLGSNVAVIQTRPLNKMDSVQDVMDWRLVTR